MAYDVPAISSVMDRKITQLDQITNNLANASTSGFKVQHLYAMNAADKTNATGDTPYGDVMYTDFSQGFFQKTENPLDLSLQGDGFFVVQTPEGQAYTRKGDFTVNKLNQIVTQEGNLVLGEGGPITLQDGKKIHINDAGAVYADDGQVGKLRVVDFSDRQALSRAGGGLYRDPGTAGIKKVDKPSVASGYIESSNVNIVREMGEMIDIQRSFETYQKVVQTLADDDKLSTSRVGRLA